MRRLNSKLGTGDTLVHTFSLLQRFLHCSRVTTTVQRTRVVFLNTAPSYHAKGTESELLQNDTTLQKVGNLGPKPAGVACMLLMEKSKFSLIDTTAGFTLVYSQLVLNRVLQFSCTDVSGQYLGCKHTREKAHLLITANQIWVCTAGGPSAGRKGGSFHSSYPGAAGFRIAQATAALVSTPASADTGTQNCWSRSVPCSRSSPPPVTPFPTQKAFPAEETEGGGDET